MEEKYMKQVILIFITIFIVNACQIKQEDALFKNVSHFNDTYATVYLSQLMTDSISIIPLETREESILGRINKIKKSKSHYYILSNDQWIFHFDENGKFISVLNKRGNGPDEYSYINDFDMYDIDNKSEIWIADNNNIKIYDADDLMFKKKISFSFIVNKFKRISKNEILIMSGQSDKSLFVVNEKGETTNLFLEKEIPYLLFRSIQFKSDQHSSYYFQLGVSNNYIVYDSEKHTFEHGSFFQKSNLLSQKHLKHIFDKYGQNFIAYLKDYNYIQSFISSKDNTWFYIKSKDSNIISRVNKNQSVSATIHPKHNIKNDLFNIDKFDFLTSLGFGESDDCLLLYMDQSSLPEDINQIITKNGQIIPVSKEDNPFIIEFFE